MHKGVALALLAAALFGAGTPFAKLLAGSVPPVMLAGLLYLGSGCGLAVCYLLRRRGGASGSARSQRRTCHGSRRPSSPAAWRGPCC